jgi:hypothetical protein
VGRLGLGRWLGRRLVATLGWLGWLGRLGLALMGRLGRLVVVNYHNLSDLDQATLTKLHEKE